MSDTRNSRRQFLLFSSVAALGAATLGHVFTKPAFAQAPAAGAKLPLVDEKTDAMAKTLGYHADASKVDTKKWSKRADAAGKKQFCSNCILFNSAKPTADSQGPCSLFPQKHVTAKGWCNSWAQNPAAK